MTSIYEARSHILIHAGYTNPSEHRHMAAHIIISADGNMRVLSENTEHLCHGILIPSGVPHAVDTMGKPVLVFLYDCTTPVAKQIRRMQCLSENCCRRIAELYAAMDHEGTAESYGRFQKRLLTLLDLSDTIPPVLDERILCAMDYIRSVCSEHISCRDVADRIHLSQGRFSHLFREQVGMTFAAYLIYQRLMHAYTRILGGASITQAALDAGFSGSSHFADVNRRVFGISAGTVLQDVRFVKVG